MNISERNFKRIMLIDDLSKRKAKLQEFCLSIGWHGVTWKKALSELNRLHEIGIRTALEKTLKKEEV